jgi:hypothetical protein
MGEEPSLDQEEEEGVNSGYLDEELAYDYQEEEEEAMDYFYDDDDEGITEYKEDNDTNEEESTKRKRFLYDKKDVFDSLESAKSALQEAAFEWVHRRTRATVTSGFKAYYSCTYAPNCPKRLYIAYHSPDTESVVWESENEHIHDDETVRKVKFGWWNLLNIVFFF